VNFVVCPDDGERVKADPGPRTGARPPILVCPACGKRYTFSGGDLTEVEPGGER
jgi:hypothetical protein